MSDANDPSMLRGSGTGLPGESSGMEKAKGEAAAVTHTATDAAKDVGHVARDEATSVVDEAKGQLQDLYHQTRSELTDEAAKQQERVATGLQTVGNDLESMARSSEEGGLARELVRETSQRVTRVASWLNEREPGDVLNEVKSFARRQPGVFIGVAAIAGAVAGRLTRALASSAHDQQEGGSASATPARVAPPAGATRPAPAEVARPTPSVPSRPPGAGTATPGVAPGAPGVAGAHAQPAPPIGETGQTWADPDADRRAGRPADRGAIGGFE